MEQPSHQHPEFIEESQRLADTVEAIKEFITRMEQPCSGGL